MRHPVQQLARPTDARPLYGELRPGSPRATRLCLNLLISCRRATDVLPRRRSTPLVCSLLRAQPGITRMPSRESIDTGLVDAIQYQAPVSAIPPANLQVESERLSGLLPLGRCRRDEMESSSTAPLRWCASKCRAPDCILRVIVDSRWVSAVRQRRQLARLSTSATLYPPTSRFVAFQSPKRSLWPDIGTGAVASAKLLIDFRPSVQLVMIWTIYSAGVVGIARRSLGRRDGQGNGVRSGRCCVSSNSCDSGPHARDRF